MKELGITLIAAVLALGIGFVLGKEYQLRRGYSDCYHRPYYSKPYYNKYDGYRYQSDPYRYNNYRNDYRYRNDNNKYIRVWPFVEIEPRTQ